MEEIDIKAKPADLPSELTIDASQLATTSDHLTIASISLPKGVEFADKELDPEQIVANVTDPAAEAAAREAEAATAAPAEAATVPADNGTTQPAEEPKSE